MSQVTKSVRIELTPEERIEAYDMISAIQQEIIGLRRSLDDQKAKLKESKRQVSEAEEEREQLLLTSGSGYKEISLPAREIYLASTEEIVYQLLELIKSPDCDENGIVERRQMTDEERNRLPLPGVVDTEIRDLRGDK